MGLFRALLGLMFSAVLVASVAPDSLMAQAVDLEITYRPTCGTCRIELSRILTLAVPPQAGAVAGYSQSALDSSGRVVFTSADASTILTFGADGRFIDEFGRRGQGPGEFGVISGLDAIRGDSLVVSDSRGRAQVFGADHAVGRTFQWPATRRGAVFLPDGRVVLQANIHSADRVGYPAHLISSGGEVLKSFGSWPDWNLDPRCTQCTSFAVTPGRQKGTVWITAPNRYDVGHWSAEGTALERIRVRDAAWFTPWESNPPWMKGRDPRPSSILRAYEDANGLLWVVGATAPLEWRPGSSSGTDTEYVIDVFDLRGQRLLMSQRLAASYRLFSAAMATATREDTNGNQFIDVFHMQLVRGSGA